MAERLRGRRAVERRAKWLSLHPLCVACLEIGHITLAAEVDHIVPLFKGGKDHDSNLQSLCVECHADKTRQDLGWGAKAGCDSDGMPTDPRHHWNK